MEFQKQVTFITVGERFGPRNGIHDPHNQDNVEFLPCFSRLLCFEYVARNVTFVHSSVGRASTNCSPALPETTSLGVNGSPTHVLRNSLSQESLPEKSSHHSPHQCPTWCKQKSSSVFSFLPVNTPLIHRNSPALSRRHRDF